MLTKLKTLYHKYHELINYAIVGGLTTIVSLVTKYGLLFTILDAADAIQLQVAVVVSWIFSVAFAYFANRKYVFQSKDPHIFREATRFVSSRVATLIMEAFILWFFITLLQLNTPAWVVVWTLVAQVVITVGNYIFSKLLVFRHKHD